MENQEFDRPLFVGQNPTGYPAPPSNGGRYSHYQQPPLNTTTMASSSRYHNGSFLVDNNYNNVFPFMNNHQQHELPAAAAAVGAVGSHQLRSVHDLYNDYYGGSSLNGFQETPISDHHHHHRNNYNNILDMINFSSLGISSPHHSPLPPQPTFLTVNNRNNHNNNTTGYCHDHRCSCNNMSTPRRDNNINVFDHHHSSSRGTFYNNNNIDQNRAAIIRSRDVRDYQTIINNTTSSDVQSRLIVKRKFPASLKEIRGKILLVAKDQEGCQYLQTKCEEGKPEDIDMIFNETKDHIQELMKDPSMNYLAQKLFKVCNERQMTHTVISVISDDANLTTMSLDPHGTRSMQKLIEVVTSAEHRRMIVSALRRITMTLTKNTNGHHVIQQCLKSFHVDEVQPILNVVADNCLDIATDKSGCCVLQQCVLHADGLSKQRIMTVIIDNALLLAEHPYGNYVVQHILGMQMRDVTADILQNLAGNFVYLAMNKFASNVVEKCLKDVPDDLSMPVIREIANSPNFLTVIQHPFGNYVAQSALQTAKGSLKEMMINKIQKEYEFLHSHPHGKRVLALARSSKPPRGGPGA